MASDGKEKRVLIVEDDRAVRRILSVTLSRAGFSTVEADSGREALAEIDKAPFGAVLLDLGLPDGLGGAVLKRLQASPDGRPVWMIVSALDEDDAVRRYGPLKGIFVPKPFDPWDLVKRLERLIESHHEDAP